MAVSVQHLSCVYRSPGAPGGSLTAVDDLSFEVGPGEIVGLIGPNGAGKTSTLRSIAGIIRPSAGAIRIAGHDLAAEPLAAKRQLAFMPDEPHLFEYLSVEEHLRLIGRLYGVPDVAPRAAALVEELELAGRERKLPGELSRGMRQKVVIACGLLRQPAALLFDEPLTGLDPIGIRRMRQTIRARADAGAAVLVSSHLLHLVEEICSRVVIMDRGRKIADAPVAELIERATRAGAGSKLEEVFLQVTGRGDAAGGGDAAS
jgi:ABC-2 type transport system ATP-binding protein